MNYYKINLAVGKKLSEERILFVQTPDAVGALTISEKIRDSKLVSIMPIDEAAYYKGVDKKYDA